MSIPRFSTDRDDHDRRSRNVITNHGLVVGLLAVCLPLAAPHAGDAQSNGCLVISEIMDGTLTGGTPKYVEITNTGLTDFTFAEGGLIVQSSLNTDLNIDVNLTGAIIPVADSFVNVDLTA